ncbi:glycosyltransferase WbuB [Paraburkholderia rhizosphaerae]|uniref:Colanic acid biosynthesis glycosyl transferase WcaI n=1 Tax=Paraburkholderia rhizosphaerae TaxID=480658 RepID=A0A4R8LC47_9BURK|nr:glycosyltransferase WbuB [Paraburkholderia rhizosphaerae]TDY40513.1 colanic acid biosynthesis glycosyl transferase WcaI [Paraburkholderia rhizosphaerae]
MKILVYGINYAPELTGIGRYTGDMAASLAAAGHDVRVVCAPPYYPAWKVSPGFSSSRYAKEHSEGVRVWRAPLWVPARPKGARRLLHLASFALSSFPVMLRHVFWRPKAVLCIAPSLLNAPAGWLVAQLTGAHAWLHVQDYEVDAAFKLGMLKGNWRKRMALAIERGLLRRFDTVSTISAKMIEHALNKGVARDKVVHFANWVDTSAIHPLNIQDRAKVPLRDELEIPADATVVLYSGNMGAKQGLEVLATAAATLAARRDLVFVFCGAGPAKDGLTAICGDLPNTRFIPLQPMERLNELLNLADIHALPQRADAADLVMPSKLTGMLASGRPVIAMAHEGTELFDTVAPRGVVVPPEALEPLVAAIEALAADPARREQLGRAGRDYALAVLSRESVLGEFESTLRLRCADTEPVSSALGLRQRDL